MQLYAARLVTRFPILASGFFSYFETGLGLMRKKKNILIDNNVQNAYKHRASILM